MSDEIDIEEHDILDNPHIRSLFPDLSVVKKEISEFLSEAVHVKQEPELIQTTSNKQVISHTFSNNNEKSSVVNDDNSLTQTKLAVNNTIFEFRTNQTNVTFQKNKIIIGSKPAKYEKPKALENDSVKKIVRYPKVILHDVKSELEKNKRYCKVCMILFPPNSQLCKHKTKKQVVFENHTTKNDLKTQESYKCRLCHIIVSSKWNLTRHYKNTHKKILTFKSVNQMVKIETNNSTKQVKHNETNTQSKYHCKVCKSTFSSLSSLYRHNRNVHNIDIKYKVCSSRSDSDGEIIRSTRANKTNNIDRECFHCKKIFPDNKSLIEHVYKILEPKSNKTTKDQHISKEEKKSEIRNNLIENIRQEKNSKQLTKPKNILNKFKHSKTQLKSSINKVAKTKMQPKRKNNTITKTREKKNGSQKRSPERTVQLRSRNKNLDYRTEESDESRSATPLSEIKQNRSIHDIIKSPTKSKVSETESVYVCLHCSYCFLIARNYIKHIRLKHKAKVPKLMKKLFDPKCKFCQARNKNIVLHNRHLSKEHPDKLMAKVIGPKKVASQPARIKKLKKCSRAFVFKSVLFRCFRCDIHFISAEAAKDHDGHLEILINWKCYICDLIFKKSDKKVHLKQHTFSNNITVQVLDAEGLSTLLYKCTQCAIHFSEKSYLEHYENCETETATSVYCKLCDILINETDIIAHEKAHNNVEDFYLNVITTDIIFFQELACESERRKQFMDNVSKRKKVLNETLVYCPTCECFLTHVRKIHTNRLCGRLVNHVCDICGIVMTPKCIDTHRKHHKVKDFNLQDLTFLDMKGKVIKPPIPAFPQCSICNIYFTSRVEIISHVCNDTQYLTCEICQINLTDAAFKLHMYYHAYTLHKKNKITVKGPKPDKSAVTSLTLNKANSIKSTSNSTTQALIRPDVSVKLINNPNKATTPERSPTNHSNSLKKNEVVYESIGKQSKILNAEIEHIQNESSDVIDFEVMFECTTCHVSVDSYDKVVEHCQNHKISKKSSSSLILCSICNLKFDTTVGSHKHVHATRKTIKKINFDVKYFSFGSNVWQNHVFQSLSAKVIDKIIGQSIYKDEHRLKFEIHQPGPPNLTVYKCAKCSNIIEAENIFKHAGCTEVNIRNIACSTCGLTFITSSARNKHQSIHVRHSGINVSSYNIVLFNRESKQHCNLKIADPSQYILYQCRNCHGLVEKPDNEHQCDVNDLKKCIDCGLLLYVKDFSNHVKKHRTSSKFRTKNMKVILTGIRKETDVVDCKTLISSFNGLMYDYTLYQCKHCKVCVKNEQLIAKHVCILGIYRFKCHKCDFYFTEKAFKPHLKTHSIDLDFKKDNINIVQFDLKCDLANSNVNDQVEDKCDDSKDQNNKEPENDSQENNNSVHSNEPNDEAAKAVTLFQCKCELHFVNKLNAIEHSKKCLPNQKISKQICTKCNLLFNPSELFTHLVNHHGDKTVNYKFNIVEITDNILDSVENIYLYKCSKCTLHFCTKDVADSHFTVCEGVMTESHDCQKCNIAFDKKSCDLEEHAVICGKEYQILLMDETNCKTSSSSIETPAA